MKGRQTFKVHVNQPLSALDYKVLSLLYQPLIGHEAFSLYLILNELSKTEHEKDFNHQFLSDLLNIRVKDLLEARKKLEALNLIETYQDLNHFIYILKQPFTARQFLVDTILGRFLESEIGEENVQVLAKIFETKKVSLDTYENMTSSFDEVFEFKATDLLKLDFEVYGKMNGRLKLNHSFNYELFLEHIKSHHKNPKLLDEKIQEKIAQIGYIYGLSEIELADIYNENANGHLLTMEALDMYARLNYEKNNQVISAKNKNTSDATFDYERINPMVIVQKFAQKEMQGMALSTVNELMSRRTIEPGVLNVLLTFILKNKNGILPNVNYLEKVLDNWLTHGVKTTEDALGQVKRIDKDRKVKYISKEKPKSEEPDWLDKYLKEIEEMG